MTRHIQHISLHPILCGRWFLKAMTTILLTAGKGRFFKKCDLCISS